MRNLIKNNLYIIALLLFFTSCDNKTVYHSFLHIPETGWQKKDTLSFNIEIKDSMTYVHLSAEVRNLSNYPYKNTFLSISHNLQDSTTWKTDTLELSLADNEGKWLGKGWGNLYQTSLLIGTVLVVHPGKYSVRISHEMKDNALLGINDVGVLVEK
ncbi:gliding motility lipoprotein GldH [Bacteroides ihuae]|uniref:gliding motility lipoprotein GldH n=1 Tax=Bacteroides ihuae TaxID=1852362 RepID=UPI0008DB1685|nr:gliding motility lipoprotein GldH [Bacteroides ihuae]